MADRDTQRALLRLGAVAAAAGGVLWLLNWSRRKPLCLGARSLSEEREKLLPLLDALSRRFFTVCMDIASVSKTVRTRIEANQVQITDGALRDQLTRQCQVFEKLQVIQTEVTAQFKCTPEEVQDMQERHAQDAEVAAVTEGFSSMLSDALGGLMPILPRVQIPEALTEDKVLEILEEVQGWETKKVLDRVGGSRVSVKDLGEVLALAHKEAWETTLQAHKDVIGDQEVYHSTLARCMRGAAFAERRQRLDDQHQERMVKLFQKERTAD